MDLELLQKRYGEILERMNAISDEAKKEKRNVSEDEAKEFDALELELESVKKNITRAESLVKQNEERGTATTKPVHIAVTRNEGENEKGKCNVWRSLGEQMSAIAQAAMTPHRTNSRLELSEKVMRAATGLNESVAGDGSFLLQQDYSAELLQRTYDTGTLASRVQRIGISATANGLKLPGIDETSRADGSRYGGIQAFWEAEADTYTGSRPKFRMCELVLKKLIGLCYTTEEILQDSNVLEQWIGNKFVEEFAFKIDDAIMNGDGVGKPQGILTSNALVTQTKESGQATLTLQLANIIKMRARMFARSRKNAAWFYNQDIESQLLQLNISVGNNAFPVFMPNMNVKDEPFDVLYGRPAYAIEQANTLSSVGDITFLDLSQYLLIDKGSMQSAQSVHVRFLNDERVFKFTYRVDGQPLWHAPLTPFKGSATQSPFITLQAR